jgi:hypothetical protein
MTLKEELAKVKEEHEEMKRNYVGLLGQKQAADEAHNEAMEAQKSEMDKQIVQERNAKDSFYRQFHEMNNRFELLHCAFDGVPGMPARKVETGEQYPRERELSVEARLIGWLAGKLA